MEEDKPNKENDRLTEAPYENKATEQPPRSPRDPGPAGKRPCLDSPQTSPRPTAFMIPPSPPKFVTIEEIMQTAHGVSNMVLAHEIAVDNDFSLKKIEPLENSLEKRITEVMHKAFWDLLDEKLREDPPDFTQALTLLHEVKHALLDLLLPQHSKLKSHINEVLDMDLIRQKVEYEAIEMSYYADFVIGLMAKLCAPARDEQVQKLRNIEGIVPLFKEIMEVLTMLRIDMANFTIQQIRPLVQQHSVEYEKEKFAEFLKSQQENNIDGLQFTRDWLVRNADVLQCPDSPREGATGGEMASVTPMAIINTAYMELLQWDDRRTLPETLVMDAGRISECKDQLVRLTLTSSVLLVTYNTVGPSIVGVSDLKQKLKDNVLIIIADTPISDLSSVIENVADQVVQEVMTSLQHRGFPVLDETRQKLLHSQIKALMEENNPVYHIIRKRMHGLMYQLLSAQPGKVQLPPGVSAVSEELSRVCGQFVRLISHNKAVFGVYYNDIITVIKHTPEDLE